MIIRRGNPEFLEPAEAPPWSETGIANALAIQTFERNAIVMVPNCIWTGYECDLLVVNRGLKIIDVEVKISRADLKKDSKKSKWWRHYTSLGPGMGYEHHRPPLPAEWPNKVWKHYYAVPAEIWDEKLLEFLPSPASGVIALQYQSWLGHPPQLVASVVRKATPCKDCTPLTPQQAIDIKHARGRRSRRDGAEAETAEKRAPIEHGASPTGRVVRPAAPGAVLPRSVPSPCGGAGRRWWCLTTVESRPSRRRIGARRGRTVERNSTRAACRRRSNAD